MRLKFFKEENKEIVKLNIEYQSIKAIGKVVRIYNNGETLNVKWDSK